MSERTEALLAEIVELQRQQLSNQAAAIEQQRIALEQQQEAMRRQRQAIRVVLPLVVVAILAILLPYAWQWVLYLLAS